MKCSVSSGVHDVACVLSVKCSLPSGVHDVACVLSVKCSLPSGVHDVACVLSVKCSVSSGVHDVAAGKATQLRCGIAQCKTKGSAESSGVCPFDTGARVSFLHRPCCGIGFPVSLSIYHDCL